MVSKEHLEKRIMELEMRNHDMKYRIRELEMMNKDMIREKAAVERELLMTMERLEPEMSMEMQLKIMRLKRHTATERGRTTHDTGTYPYGHFPAQKPQTESRVAKAEPILAQLTGMCSHFSNTLQGMGLASLAQLLV